MVGAVGIENESRDFRVCNRLPNPMADSDYREMAPCCRSGGGRNRLCHVAVEASHSSCASVEGLLLGGTWTAWHAPNDVPIFSEWCVRAYHECFRL
jgi:hypothetical protein